MFRNSWMIIQALPIRGIMVGATLALTVLFGGSAWAGDIRIVSATAHFNNDQMNGHRIAVYMDIENAGGGDDRLYSVRSEISRKAMLSVTGSMRGDMRDSGHDGMEMAEVKHHQTAALKVPAGEVVHLKKGGSHIMLMDLNQMPATGATFPITLFFEKAGSVTVDVTMESVEFAR